MTRRGLLAVLTALIPQEIFTTNNISKVNPILTNEYTIFIITPLIIKVDNQEFKFTPHELAEILKSDK